MNYRTSKQYKKLPRLSRKILNQFDIDNDKKKLFQNIRKSIQTQNTIKSKHTRQSIFRGLLRNFFNFTEDDLKPIDYTPEQKQAYYESNNISIEDQFECIITNDMLKEMIKHDILYLLLTSGRRIGELIDNDIKLIDNDIYMTLNKKKDKNKLHKIFILGSKKQWLEKLEKIKANGKNSLILNNQINKILKTIIPENYYKRSSHICRAIYIKYIHKYLNKDKKTFPNIIKKYLNHNSINSSIFYQHINLENCKDILNNQYIEYNNLKLNDLKKICKQKNLKFGKLRKFQIIKLLENN
jgi:integrase